MTLEDIGIKLRLNDFKLIFNSLDFDSKGVVDFDKFCHLNIDRYSLIDLIKKVRFRFQSL
jgi:Ca2+-binding EF-hand superfamily protein